MKKLRKDKLAALLAAEDASAKKKKKSPEREERAKSPTGAGLMKKDTILQRINTMSSQTSTYGKIIAAEFAFKL